jgi:glycosyltransferase involved in cell wall biosynthesis
MKFNLMNTASTSSNDLKLIPTGKSIVFGWSGLPIYAARCIEYCRLHSNLTISVVFTPPSVPIQSIEQHLKCPMRQVYADKPQHWSDLSLNVPDIFIHTGWAYPVFNCLAQDVRRNGGQVVSMVDNCWKGDLRQLLGALYFRFKLRHLFNATWVPGKSGRKLSTFLGMPSDRIFNGLYGMDPSIFKSGLRLADRKKELVFVGRLIERKGFPEFLAAFVEFIVSNPDWTLRIIGDGPLRDTIPHIPQIKYQPFSPPEAIALAMRNARALLLPSREEHWGLVVHEAALSGCALLLSDKVGSHPDLLENKVNGLRFRARNTQDIYRALTDFASWSDNRLEQAQQSSETLAKGFGPLQFFDSFCQIMALCASCNRKK